MKHVKVENLDVKNGRGTDYFTVNGLTAPFDGDSFFRFVEEFL